VKEALIYSAAYAVPGVFAALFYREDLFADVFWALTRASIWVALIAYAFSRVAGHAVLVNAQLGNDRLQGLLIEPSAWAPVVAAGILMALRRRSRVYVVLVVLVAILTQSPTVYIVVAISIPVYYLLTIRNGFRTKRLLVLLIAAVALPVAVNFLQTANADTYLNSSNRPSVVVGRMISGVQSIDSGGTTGTNGRFTSTKQAISNTEDLGLLNFGGGPGSSNAYFSAEYPNVPGQSVGLRTNALWVDILFNFGRVGVAVLFLLLATATIRMRRVPAAAEILLPFIVVSFINSAEGVALYQFSILAICLFAFGWGLPQAWCQIKKPIPVELCDLANQVN